MSIAAYNRGTRAISRHISQCLAESRRCNEVPALPVGWSVLVRANVVDVRDETETLIHRDPIAFKNPRTLNQVVIRALDPCLRNPNLPLDGGHALNGWQLHYSR